MILYKSYVAAWMYVFVLSMTSLFAEFWLLMFGVLAIQTVVLGSVAFTFFFVVSAANLHSLHKEMQEELKKHADR